MNEIEIDVAIPTLNSGELLEESLSALHVAEENAESVTINRVLFADGGSTDQTREIAVAVCNRFSWTFEFNHGHTTLPEARQVLIESVNTAWFLFLDDDVRVSEDYLQTQVKWTTADPVGAIQGRKHTDTSHPSTWIRRRANRGGTHATLIRTESVSGITIPSDLDVLEDEFIRRYIEGSGWTWVFSANSTFRHNNQNRHDDGFKEGYLGGYHALKSPQQYVAGMGLRILTLSNPIDQISRIAGWAFGAVHRRISPPDVPGRTPRQKDSNTQIDVEPVKLDIGCGPNCEPGYVGIDIREYPGVDIVADVESGIPLKDNTVSRVRVEAILEHVDDMPELMSEIHRVCVEGARVTGRVPHWRDRNAYIDPTHVRPYDQRTFDFWDSTTEFGRRDYFEEEFRVHHSERVPRIAFWKSRPIKFDLEVIKGDNKNR